MKIKYLMISMIVATTSMQYTTPEITRTQYKAPKKQAAAESIYDRNLQSLRNQENGYTKNQSILRALTGTAEYTNKSNETAVLNKITGTITFKDANGKPIKQLMKTLNGKTKEIQFIKPNGQERIRPGKRIITFDTEKPQGKRTIQNKFDNGTIDVVNINDNNETISAGRYSSNTYDGIDNQILQTYDPKKISMNNNEHTFLNQNASENDHNIESKPREYRKADKQLRSNMTTGLIV